MPSLRVFLFGIRGADLWGAPWPGGGVIFCHHRTWPGHFLCHHWTKFLEIYAITERSEWNSIRDKLIFCAIIEPGRTRSFFVTSLNVISQNIGPRPPVTNRHPLIWDKNEPEGAWKPAFLVILVPNFLKMFGRVDMLSRCPHRGMHRWSRTPWESFSAV